MSNQQLNELTKRYKDAYVLTKIIIDFGKMVKFSPVVLFLVQIIITIAVAYNEQISVLMLLVTLVVGLIFHAMTYITGILITAIGQMMLTNLDIAVNTSPFIDDNAKAMIIGISQNKNDDMKQATMSLPNNSNVFIGDMIKIPGGKFLYGDDKGLKYIYDYEISKYPITVAQYRKFCDASKWEMPEEPSWGWVDSHPIVNVCWIDAKVFCDFYGLRLPSEEEWEKAARGSNGRIFPWGDEWDANKCVNNLNSPYGTQPTKGHPEGSSPYGCMDMSGNVWEWTSSYYDFKKETRVLRGGSWNNIGANGNFFRCFYRLNNDPEKCNHMNGFRVAR